MARTALYDRDQALDKATQLFWERGYHACSMKHLEQALDMRPGSIYAAFGSKDDLFREALAGYLRQNGAELDEQLNGAATIVEGLKGYLRKVVENSLPVEGAPARACMLVKTLLEVSYTQTELAQEANRALGKVEDRFTELLSEARQRGELKPDIDCARLARLLQAQLIGLRAFAQRDTSADHIRQLGEDMAALLDQATATSND